MDTHAVTSLSLSLSLSLCLYESLGPTNVKRLKQCLAQSTKGEPADSDPLTESSFCETLSDQNAYLVGGIPRLRMERPEGFRHGL